MAEPATYDAAAEAASSGLPQFDFATWATQSFWLLLTFGLLYFVLATFILPRLRDGISERDDRIRDDLDQAANFQREAEEAEKAYTQMLADARAKAMNVAESTKSSVDAEIAAEIEAADADAERQAEIAETRIAEVKSAAMQNIESIATDATAEIVAALTGKAPSAAKVRAAVTKA